MKKNKNPHNSKGQLHGLRESYYSNGQLRYKGNFINDKQDGIWWVNWFKDKQELHLNI